MQRIVDAIVMVLRVALEIWIPGDFLAEDHVAVDHSGGFAVGSAEIETDPAAIEMAAEGHGRFARCRQRINGARFDA